MVVRRSGQPARGFTYIALLFAVALLGAVLGATGEVWHTVRQRDQEADLRRIGEAYRTAIGRYYMASPDQPRRFPRKLSDLLEDDRYPEPRRYLRRLYRDPVTDSPEWGLVAAPDGGIAGVYSLSEATPLGKMDAHAPAGPTDTPAGASTTGVPNPSDSAANTASAAPTVSASTSPFADTASRPAKKRIGYSAWVFAYAAPATPVKPSSGPPTATSPAPAGATAQGSAGGSPFSTPFAPTGAAPRENLP